MNYNTIKRVAYMFNFRVTRRYTSEGINFYGETDDGTIEVKGWYKYPDDESIFDSSLGNWFFTVYPLSKRLMKRTNDTRHAIVYMAGDGKPKVRLYVPVDLKDEVELKELEDMLHRARSIVSEIKRISELEAAVQRQGRKEKGE